MIKRGKIFSFSHYLHYIMIKTEKRVFSFSHYLHYTIIKRKNSFLFHLVTTFITPWSREQKSFFFSFTRYVHYTMTKREKEFFFISSLRSLHHDQETKKFFIHLVTTFTTPWSRDKKGFYSFRHYVHYTMIKREKSFFFI